MLRAYKATTTFYVLSVVIKTEILTPEQLSNFIGLLDFLNLKDDLCLLTYKELTHPVRNVPVINVDEYVNYLYLMDIPLSHTSKLFIDTLPMLLEILESKYGIEYVNVED